MTFFSLHPSKKEDDFFWYQIYSVWLFMLIIIFVAIDLLMITPFGIKMGYIEVSGLVSRAWEDFGYKGLAMVYMLNISMFLSVLIVIGIIVSIFKNEKVAWVSIVIGEIGLLLFYFTVNLLNVIVLKYT